MVYLHSHNLQSMETAKTIITKIITKGVLETVFQVFIICWKFIYSFVGVSILKIRGYRIAYGVQLATTCDFFQSSVGAIRIDKGSRIERNTRINSGFGGYIHIGKGVLVDDGTHIMAQASISIGDFSQISSNCFITDFNHVYKSRNMPIVKQGYNRKPVVIGKDVWIGTHSVILSGVTIGDGAVIGAGSVVTHDVESFCVVAGNPAKVLKRRI